MNRRTLLAALASLPFAGLLRFKTPIARTKPAFSPKGLKPTAWFRFDGTSDSFLIDRSGNGNRLVWSDNIGPQP